MPIRIIRPGREFMVQIGDAEFRVRRMTDAEKTALEAAHAVGSPERISAFIKAVIVGWTGVLTEDGQPAVYDPELLIHLNYDDVIGPILDRLRGGLVDPFAKRAAGATLPPSPGTQHG